jgi:hypothetical protein
VHLHLNTTSVDTLQDLRQETEGVPSWKVDDSLAVAWFRVSPEDVVINAEEIETRQHARKERERVNEPKWRTWNKQALASLDNRNRAGGRSNQQWIVDFGPWDLSPAPDVRRLGFIPSPHRAADQRPALRTTEGRALARARERYLNGLANAAEYPGADELVRGIAVDGRNRLNPNTEQDLVHIIRVALGFRRETWELSLQKPAPLFLQEFTGASCALSLYVPPAAHSESLAAAAVATVE